jgi:hypothetical protein
LLTTKRRQATAQGISNDCLLVHGQKYFQQSVIETSHRLADMSGVRELSRFAVVNANL